MGRIKYSITACFLLLLNVSLFAFSDSTIHATLQQNIPGNFTDFYADNLGNIYIITANNQVRKYTDKGDSVAVFNDVRSYGTLSTMDVSNPLRIILYYKDFTTLLILDRFLNIRNRIDLRSTGITQATAIAQSYDNSIWVFDEQESKIKKVDELGKITFESTDFRLLFDDAVLPDKMIDYNKTLYLYDKKRGWYLFDYYGAYQKKFPYPGWTDVQVFENILTGLENNTINSLPLNNFAADISHIEIDISFDGVIKMQYQTNKMYVLRNSGLDIYLMQ